MNNHALLFVKRHLLGVITCVAVLSGGVMWFLQTTTAKHALHGTPYIWQLPSGFPAPPVPSGNPMTVEKVELGRHLFYDKRLSGNGLQSCGTCHQQELAFTDGVALPVGSTGELVGRNSMSLVNVAYNSHFTWAHNGLNELEQQVLIPLFSEQPVEMGVAGKQDQVLAAFHADEHYQRLFEAAYPEADTVTMDHLVKALASFVRSIVSFQSPFDRYAYYGEDHALPAEALKGLELFMSERLECRHCHSGFNFSDTSQHAGDLGEPKTFHITGLYYPLAAGSDTFLPDRGLYKVTGLESDKDRFRAPSLRNIALTAPYMHDGSVGSLAGVIDFYADAGRDGFSEGYGDGRLHPHKSLFIKGFSLTPSERSALDAFFLSLTDQKVTQAAKWAAPSYAQQISQNSNK